MLPTDQPSMVVLDEMPYLVGEDPGFEGTLQKLFDRTLSKLPVLLVLIGSDLSMMESLNTYGRPFYQRGTEMVVPPLNPAEVAAMLDRPGRGLRRLLVSGGLPLILDEWPRGAGLWEYLEFAVKRPTSASSQRERALAAEFPTEAQARLVLGAIGHGERTFSLIGRAAGGLNPGSLSRSLDLLIDKRIVEADVPLSTQPSKETRYRVADPHLRFWLSFLGPACPRSNEVAVTRFSRRSRANGRRGVDVPSSPSSGRSDPAARRRPARWDRRHRRLLDPHQRPGDRPGRRRSRPHRQT